MRLIHYGVDRFNPNLFKPIRNRNWVKPTGGLWTSPVQSKYGWVDFCKQEEFIVNSLELSFIIEIDDSRVYKIDNLNDLVRVATIPNSYNSNMLIDYEQLATEYDAIWLTYDGQFNTRFGRPNLYGWDVETVLILNKECIINQ